jgi:beta-lactamase regulating signal transducer with metallopeptidase domain
MFRPHFLIVPVSLLFFPMLDAAVKGALVLLLAGAVCLALRRDSAATRHMIWATAVLLVLGMPLLSLALPKWRVLPNWGPPPAESAVASRTGPARSTGELPAVETARSPQFAEDDAGEPMRTGRTNAADAPVVEQASRPNETERETQPGLLASIAAQPTAVAAMIWLAGSAVVLLRLLLAAVFLKKSAVRCRVVATPSDRNASRQNDRNEGEETLQAALAAAAARLGVRRPVRLLLDPRQSMPVIWGLVRPRMRLPAEAVNWGREQLQSVLLHELAHLRRHDLVVLALTQIACALNWFNPLVWLAAWRLHVERERACDDLVLSAGVRPSAYAGHVVEVVSRLRPMAWPQSCGLAMARTSSLESRLRAVLSGQINRRGLTRLAVAAVLSLGLVLAIPVAMLHATDPSENTVPTADEKAADEKVAEQKAADPTPPTRLDGANLGPGIEERLQWGEATNGLRAALVRPQALGQPDAGEIFDLRLVVQNVSQTPIRFSTAFLAAESPRLVFRERGVPLSAFTESKPVPAEFALKPREVAVLRLFKERLQGQSITGETRDASLTAEFTVKKAPAGFWTGKLTTAEMAAGFAGYGLMPKHKDARAVFRMWNTNARADGKIPGALIGVLGESVKMFIKYNPTWETTPQLSKMLPRFDAARDWTGREAIDLLDELAAVQATPLSMATDREFERTIQTGTPLPPELAAAPWGETLPNGLRMAWLLEPRGTEHRLNTPLKGRILIHNAGKATVVFRTRMWHQLGHRATDAKGAEIKLESVSWLTRGRFVPFRLGPGEFVELNTPGIGVGRNTNADDWQNVRVGSWIEAKAGDEVTLTTSPLPLFDWNEKPQTDGSNRWWLDFITARLARERPLPADAAERKRLLYHVAMDLFGTPLDAEVTEAFVADRGPDALESLAKRLANRPGVTPYAGSLTSGPTKFRVLPADPDAAKRPRTANNPGRYTLGDNAALVVVRRPVGERIVNEANVEFFSPDPKKPAPGKPHDLKLPDGYDSWAVAWIRGSTVLWLQEKAGFRRFDFSDPANVEEGLATPDAVPTEIREALRGALPEPAKPAPPASSPPASARP